MLHRLLVMRADWRGVLGAVRRHRVSTTLAIAALGIGLGVNLVLLHAVRQLLFLPPAGVRDGDHLVRVASAQLIPGSGWVQSVPQSWPVFEALRSAGVFGEAAAFAQVSLPVALDDDPRDMEVSLVTLDYFRILRTRMSLGRSWQSHETAEAPVVISHRLWREHWNGSPTALGSTVAIGRARYTIVGVTEPDFSGVGNRVATLFVPFESYASQLIGREWRTDDRYAHLVMLGRLRPGHTAEASGHALNQRLRAGELPALGSQRFFFTPLLGTSAGSTLATVGALLGGLSILLFFAACAGAAGLLLSRMPERRRSLAIRMALGAGRGIVPRTAAIESTLFAALGTMGAVAITIASGRAVERWLLPTFAWRDTLPIGWLLGACAVAMALTAALVFLAEWVATRRLAVTTLVSPQGAPRGASGRISSVVIATQAAVVVVLVAGALVVGSALRNLRGADLGFDADRIAVAAIGDRSDPRTPEQLAGVYRRAATLLAPAPEVAATTIATAIPLSRSVATWVRASEADVLPLKTGGPYVVGIDESYLATLGARLVQGRPFSADEIRRGERVALVNETMARQTWPAGDAVGQCLYVASDGACYTVTGVMRDARRERLMESATLQFYIPLAHALRMGLGSPVLFVRGVHADGRAAARAAAALRQVGAGEGPPSVQRLDDLAAFQTREWRMANLVMSVYALVAFVVACLSLCGLVLMQVEQRRRELAIRHALGSGAGALAWTVAARPARAVALGCVAAGVGALSGWPHLARFAYGVTPLEAGIAIAFAVGLAGACLAASVAFGFIHSRLSTVDALRS